MNGGIERSKITLKIIPKELNWYLHNLKLIFSLRHMKIFLNIFLLKLKDSFKIVHDQIFWPWKFVFDAKVKQ